MLTQDGLGRAFHAEDGSLDLDRIRPHFQRALDTLKTGKSDGPDLCSEEWEEGFTTDSFAAVLCPRWLLRQIREHVLDHGGSEGLWDIAEIPGPGGNWGGSFWAIPDQGTENDQRAAWTFITRAIQEDIQLSPAESLPWDGGYYPSRVMAYNDPSIADTVMEYFSDAPVGIIFPEAALGYAAPIAYGLRHRQIVDTLDQILIDVHRGVLSSENAWAAFSARAEEAFHDPAA